MHYPDRKMHLCSNCENNTPMVHTGFAEFTNIDNQLEQKWLTLSLHDEYGFLLYSWHNPSGIEINELRAFCTVCGHEISGSTFISVAYQK